MTFFPTSKFVDLATETAQLNDQEFIECILAVIHKAVLLDESIQNLIKEVVTRLPLPENVSLIEGLPYKDDKVYIPDVLEIQRQIL